MTYTNVYLKLMSEITIKESVINVINNESDVNEDETDVNSIDQEPVPETFKQYLAGFFDGDGCISVQKFNSGGYSVGISFSQSNEEWVETIKMYYPYLKISSGKRKGHRCEFSLKASGKQIEPLVDDLSKYSILKYEQLNEAKKFFQYINILNTNEQKEVIYQKLKDLKKNSPKNKPYDRLNHVYVAGFFDAEGCITLYNRSMRIKITQKSDETILKRIGELYNNTNNISHYSLCFYSKESIIDFLNSIRDYCIYKSPQIDTMMEYLYSDGSDYQIVEQKLKNDKKIDPELEFCENTNQQSIYNYLRKKTSCLPTTSVVGRQIRILVKDRKTGKYIGLLCLSSDVYSLGERDAYLTKMDIDYRGNKDEFLKKFLNISCCVPLQPFGFNTNGGKLMASLAFSKEVFDYHLEKYGEPIYGFITTSIRGKSIQYDRLPHLKFIGFTKGFGTVQIPESLYNECKNYDKIWKATIPSKRVDKFTFLKQILKDLELPNNMLYHGQQRGIYFGFLFNSKFDETAFDNLKTVKQIYIQWKDRWCTTRLKNVIDTDRLKLSSDLYTIEKLATIPFKTFALPEKDFVNKLSDELIKEILLYKDLSLDDISNKVYQKYKIKIDNDYISKIFGGKVKPENIDTEYLLLLTAVQRNKVSRVSAKRKFSDEEIVYVIMLKENLNLTYDNIKKAFEQKFKKEITKTNISDIVLRKTKPVNESDQARMQQEQLQKEQQKLQVKKEQQQKRAKEKRIKSDAEYAISDKLTDDQILVLMKLKSNNNLTTQDASDIIKKNYNVYIKRDIISKIWKGEKDVPERLKQTSVYKDMLSITKQRTKRLKFTQEEFDYIKSLDKAYNNMECQKMFLEKFNKTINIEYIRELRKDIESVSIVTQKVNVSRSV